MLTVKVIKDFEYVERPVVQRVLQDAKCFAEVLKNPIAPQIKMKINCFNPDPYPHPNLHTEP